MKNISIIIPSYNEEERIGDLLKSTEELDYPKDKYEVIVVNDGSTDKTKDIAKAFEFVKLIDLKVNKGRFLARKIGSQEAKYDNLFFIDSRSVVDKNALNAINCNNKYRVMIGHSLGVNNPNVFETFYTAIRRKVFPKTSNEIIELNSENFDKYPKGTGVLFVKKDVWFRAVNEFKRTDANVSDDTKILFSISKRETIAINPHLKITNFTRSSFWGSIKHLYNRGIKFVDYYLNPKKRNFWLVFVFPFLFSLFIIFLFCILDVGLMQKVIGMLLLYLLGTIYLSYSLRSFLKIFYIAPLIIVTFYLGILKGIFLKLIHVFKK